jgi:protease-4
MYNIIEVIFMFSSKKKIYIVNIFGEIQASNGGFSSSKPDMQKVIKSLHDIGKEENVGGVIIRLNTPGGTTGTSEEVARMIIKLKEKGIPIIASIADVCCSGGYWIASTCDKIFANKTSLTGSIGVIMMVPNYKGLSDKLGVNYITVKAGKMKDMGNPFREMTDEEKIFLEDSAAETHKIFIEEVMKNRHLNEVKDELFDGRFFSADYAKEHKMIDEIGTFYDALDFLLNKLGLEEDEVEIKTAVKKKGLISKVFSSEISDIFTTSIRNIISDSKYISMK